VSILAGFFLEANARKAQTLKTVYCYLIRDFFSSFDYPFKNVIGNNTPITCPCQLASSKKLRSLRKSKKVGRSRPA
jgi:hypothetical protein